MADNTEETPDEKQEEQTQETPDVTAELEKWKAMSRKNERFAKEQSKKAEELESRLSEFEEATKSEQEKLLDQARKEAADAARTEVLGQVQRERLETSVVRHATGRLTDPDDAVRFLNLDDLGDASAEEISAAIASLVESKPYLASGTRPVGSADQGARKTSDVPQLTRDDLKTMSAAQIEQARVDGQLDDLMGVK